MIDLIAAYMIGRETESGARRRIPDPVFVPEPEPEIERVPRTIAEASRKTRGVREWWT